MYMYISSVTKAYESATMVQVNGSFITESQEPNPMAQGSFSFSVPVAEITTWTARIGKKVDLSEAVFE